MGAIVRAELAARISLINHLETVVRCEEAFIVTELLIKKSKLRADLVMFTENSTTAFEIKSARDSLRRLPNQINSYLEYFDQVVLVLDQKHFLAAKKMVPPSVGIWILSDNGFKVVRAPRMRRLSRRSLVGLLPIATLRDITQVDRMQTAIKRSVLEDRASRLPMKFLKKQVIDSYRAKFRIERSHTGADIVNIDKCSSYIRCAYRKTASRKATPDAYNDLMIEWSDRQSTQASSVSLVS